MREKARKARKTGKTRTTRLPLYEEDSAAARSALTSLDDALPVQHNVRRALDHGLARHFVCSVSSSNTQNCCDSASALVACSAGEHLVRTSRVGLCLSARTCLCSSLPMYVPFSKKIGGSNAPMVPCFFLTVVLAQMLVARAARRRPHCCCGRGQRAARHHARGHRGNPRVSGGGHRACPRVLGRSVPGQQQRRNYLTRAAQGKEGDNGGHERRDGAPWAGVP